MRLSVSVKELLYLLQQTGSLVGDIKKKDIA